MYTGPMHTTLTLTRPDDWHIHLRDGAVLVDTVAAASRQFGRAIAMPNLRPPVVTVDEATAYRERILAARPAGSGFEPLMTLYLTDKTSPQEVRRAASTPYIVAAKLYPAGATTNSDSGVTDLDALRPTLEAMAETGLLLLVHGEVTDRAVDIFDREAAFIERVLGPLVQALPQLKLVFEHITTAAAVAFVDGSRANVGATITAHHLLLNRNDLLVGGIKPHRYCLPVLKRERDRAALIRAATGGSPRYFLGTDSAPHARPDKESACGSAGSYTAHAALELYAEAFASVDALDRLEGFASHHGPDFYGLPRNSGTITLEAAPWRVPDSVPFGDEQVVPLRAGETLAWRLVGG